MSKEENSDLKEIKECLIGTEFDRKKGLVYKVDCLITTSNKHDNNQLIMQNQINAIQEQMNKKRSFGGAIKTFFLLFAK